MSQALRDKAGNYRINGKTYKSVTTIIKEQCPHIGLDTWKERNPDWPVKLKHAGIYGTLMHLQIQSQYTDLQLEVPHEMPYYKWPKDIEDELEGRMQQWLKLDL